MNLLTLEFTIDCPPSAGGSHAVLQKCEECVARMHPKAMRRDDNSIVIPRGSLAVGGQWAYVGGGEVTVIDGSPVRVSARFDQRPSLLVLLGWGVYSFGLVFGLGLGDTPVIAFPVITSMLIYLLSLTGVGAIEPLLRRGVGIPEERSISPIGWVVIGVVMVVGVGALAWWAFNGPGAP